MVLETIQLQAGYKKNSRNTIKTGPAASLKANTGDLIAFMGHNGIGKSTFLRTLANLQPPIDGEIRLFNKNISSYTSKELALHLAYVSTGNAGHNYMTIFETVALGRYPYTNWLGSLEDCDHQVIEKALNLVNLSDMRQKPVSEISDGERQRVMIARAIAQDTPVILLDEPTAFLDLQNKYQITHLLSNLAHKENKTIIFTTHDLNIALDEADKIWFFSNSSAIEAAPEEFVMNSYFKDFFGSQLVFDDRNFSVKRVPEHLTEVQIEIPDENHYFFIQKAMERIGCKIVQSTENVISTEDNEMLIYTYFSKGFKNRFNDIYSLCRYIRHELQT